MFEATLEVPVPKRNGTILLCGDFKVTVIKYAKYSAVFSTSSERPLSSFRRIANIIKS